MQLLSQVFSVKMLYRQLITITLSIYKNFSLGLLCKALHNKPQEIQQIGMWRFHLGQAPLYEQINRSGRQN